MKKVLLYAPKFYGYETHIINAFNKSDYYVKFINHHTYRIIDSIVQFLPQSIQRWFYDKIVGLKLKKYGYDIDLFLVIRGDFLNKNHIVKLKNKNPIIRCIMYQWDSVKNFNYLNLVKYFDAVYTFDFADAENYNIKYLPLFYTKDINISNNSSDSQIDFLIIGVFNVDRYKYYLKLKDFCRKYNKNLYTHIYIPFGYYIKNQIKKNRCQINIKDVRFRTIKRNKLIELYKNSKVFVDICHKQQTGMSMRTIEAYGMNKKLLTSNTYINNDNYVKEIAYLYSDSTDEEILNFLESTTPKYIHRDTLSIDKWIKTLISSDVS